MSYVLGVGGVFFRSADPGALSAWYAEHLGIPEAPRDYDADVWHQAGGPTVFAPFPQDTAYFGSDTQMFMLNLRVSDLDAQVKALRAADIEVIVDPQNYPNGRFARLHDPEGNPIELWEPAQEGKT